MELIVTEIEPGVFLADHPDPTFRPRRVVIGFTDETCTVMDPDASHHSLRDLDGLTFNVTRNAPPTEAELAAAYLAETESDGSMIRVIEDNAAAIQALCDHLGIDNPTAAEALAKVSARKAKRALLRGGV